MPDVVEKKERTLRLFVQMAVIEPLTGGYIEKPQELTWAQRTVVLPINRLAAFDLNAMAEAMVHDGIESTAE